MQQYIGIDVGGTHVKYGVINSDGEELIRYARGRLHVYPQMAGCGGALPTGL